MTVLCPFLPPEIIDDRVLSVVRATVAAVPRFAVKTEFPLGEA